MPRDPDWLRVGTDVVGGTPAPTFDAVFTLAGDTVPMASTLSLVLMGMGVNGIAVRRQRTRETRRRRTKHFRPESKWLQALQS